MPKQPVRHIDMEQGLLYWSDQVSDKILSDLQYVVHFKGALTSQIYITKSTTLPGISEHTHNGLSSKQGSCIVLVALKSGPLNLRDLGSLFKAVDLHIRISLLQRKRATALAGMSLAL